MGGCKQMLTVTSTDGETEPARAGPFDHPVLDEGSGRGGDRADRVASSGRRAPRRSQTGAREGRPPRRRGPDEHFLRTRAAAGRRACPSGRRRGTDNRTRAGTPRSAAPAGTTGGRDPSALGSIRPARRGRATGPRRQRADRQPPRPARLRGSRERRSSGRSCPPLPRAPRSRSMPRRRPCTAPRREAGEATRRLAAPAPRDRERPRGRSRGERRRDGCTRDRPMPG